MSDRGRPVGETEFVSFFSLVRTSKCIRTHQRKTHTRARGVECLVNRSIKATGVSRDWSVGLLGRIGMPARYCGSLGHPQISIRNATVQKDTHPLFPSTPASTPLWVSEHGKAFKGLQDDHFSGPCTPKRHRARRVLVCDEGLRERGGNHLRRGNMRKRQLMKRKKGSSTESAARLETNLWGNG